MMVNTTTTQVVKNPQHPLALFGVSAARWFTCTWSLLYWRLGNLRWLVVLTVAGLLGAAFAYFHYTQLTGVEKIRFSKAQTQRTAELKARSDLLRQSQSMPAVTSKASLEKLELPKEESLKLAPLHRFLQERSMRGIQLKQVDYQWDKEQGLQNKQRAVRKVDVIISLDASYPSLREWLGALLLQTPNAQLTNLQIQRVSKEAQLTNCLVTVSVYFQGLI